MLNNLDALVDGVASWVETYYTLNSTKPSKKYLKNVLKHLHDTIMDRDRQKERNLVYEEFRIDMEILRTKLSYANEELDNIKYHAQELIDTLERINNKG